MTAKSRKNRRSTITPEGADVAPTAVPATEGAPPAISAAHAVWAALAANPGATTMAVSVAAPVSRASTSKALAAFEEAGTVRCAWLGSGANRVPDTWEIIPSTDDAHDETDQEPISGEAEVAPENEPGAETHTIGAPEEPVAPAEAVPQEEAADDLPDTEPVIPAEVDDAACFSAEEHAVPEETPGHDLEVLAVPDEEREVALALVGEDPAHLEARQALGDLYGVVIEAMRALEAGDTATALERTETIYVDAARVRRVVKTVVTSRKTSGGERTRPGQLRERVAAHLADHPDAEFTPYELGRALGHSAGAVAVALDRLSALGTAQLVCDRPRRFMHAG